MLDFYVKTGIRFSLRDKRLFEITEVEITRVDCIFFSVSLLNWESYACSDEFRDGFRMELPIITYETISVYV